MGTKKHYINKTEFIEHIDVIKFSEDCDLKDLQEIKLSASAVSCTKYIKTISFAHDDEEYLICDSPGLEDTRGAELDVANIYGVIYAAQQCSAILPVIVISQDSLEERMIGLKRIALNLGNMFKNIESYKTSFVFLFTKFKNTRDEKMNFKARVNDSYDW